MRTRIILIALVCIGANKLWADSEKIKIQVHGQGWFDQGRIMTTSDSVLRDGNTEGNSVNISNTWLSSFGAQVVATADIADNLEAVIGIGAYRVTHSVGSYMTNTNITKQPFYYAISFYKNYLPQSRLTYYLGDKATPWFSITGGSFSYNYNPDVKNLGAYLLRGAVYPGILVSGFKDFSIDSTKSNVMGLKVHNQIGNFSHDLILKNETDLPPTFDLSLAYIAKYRAFEALDFGFGVNSYRLIPYVSKLEKPGHLGVALDNGRSIDTVGANGDSAKFVYLTHQGVKVMGMFSIDLKHWLNASLLGSQDLKLYGEAALIGISNQGSVYKNRKERIPVMLGFNLPVFGWLDFLSVEGEWYGSKYRNDVANLGSLNGVADWTEYKPTRVTPSPAPVSGFYADSTKDNIKWSINIEKTIQKHLRLSGQVASDHYRPAPIATGLISSTGGTAEAFTRPSNMYFEFRLAYLF